MNEKESPLTKELPLANCKKYIDKLSKANYHGVLKLKFRDGFIYLGERQDKIKFDNSAFE